MSLGLPYESLFRFLCFLSLFLEYICIIKKNYIPLRFHTNSFFLLIFIFFIYPPLKIIFKRIGIEAVFLINFKKGEFFFISCEFEFKIKEISLDQKLPMKTETIYFKILIEKRCFGGTKKINNF